MNLQLRMQPKQAAYLKLVDEGTYSRLGEGGSRGGGKSKTLRDVQLFRRLKYPDTIGWLFRRTLEELRDNHIDPLFRDYSGLGEYWHSDARELVFPNKSKLQFKIGETEGDILKNRGKQAMDISVDESNLMRESEMRELGMCCRWPGYAEHQCKLMEGFNPGGIGHNRIRRIYIDKTFLSNEVPGMYHFTPIYAWDNVAWAETALMEDNLTVVDYYRWSHAQRFQYFTTRTQYGRELNALPEPDRSQQLLGEFNNFEGQVFGILDDGVHNIDNWLRDDRDWKEFLTRGMRYTGCLDHATTGTRAYEITALDAQNIRFALDEVYLKNVLNKDVVDEIKRMKTKYPRVDCDYIDPSTESDTQENVLEITSVQDAYRKLGLPTIIPQRRKISVGLDLMNQRLRMDESLRHPFTGERGSPAIFISRSRCPNLWREMSELQCIVRDGKIKYVGADHATDDLRYIEVEQMKPPEDKQTPPDETKIQSSVITMARRTDAKWAAAFDKKTKPATTWWNPR